MSLTVGSSGRVYAFEPQPVLAAYLQGLARRTAHGNVTVCPVALSDHARRQSLTIPRYTGWATLEPCDTVEGCTHIEVPVETLDGYLEWIDARRPISLIKIDVELHELPVLRGGRKLLAADTPILLIESRPICQLPAEKNATFDFLGQLGYEGYFFASGELVPLTQYSLARHGSRESGIQNYVFLHAGTAEFVSARRPFAVRWTDAKRQAA
jgi:FkbM family methyltransferase